jgi:hypothetical protein
VGGRRSYQFLRTAASPVPIQSVSAAGAIWVEREDAGVALRHFGKSQETGTAARPSLLASTNGQGAGDCWAFLSRGQNGGTKEARNGFFRAGSKSRGQPYGQGGRNDRSVTQACLSDSGLRWDSLRL